MFGDEHNNPIVQVSVVEHFVNRGRYMHFCESQCNWFVSKWTYFSLLVPFWRSPIYLNAKECNITSYPKKINEKKEEEPNDDYMKNFYKSLYFEIQNSRSNGER